MWVSRVPEEPGECGRSYANLTLASSLNSTMDQSNYSLGEALLDRAQSASKDMIDEEEDPIPLVPPTRVETEEDRAINYGPYSKHYDTLHSIGKGAFRFVKLGQRKVDKKQVVVKFIRRAKVFSDCWVQDEKHGRMPLEVSLLTKLDHPNIVKIQDVFENAEFIQMVMEKHGSGMDLFEFIDRSPQMDEALASYIFRQMVSAVSYLHSKNILHRVIKDENVIVNEQFQIKLIDFGAVAFLESGKIFATFCGTLEYCSPEVLMGNKYRGPELEVWSMGVTLYTLVFGENPFFDVDETIKCVLKPPFSVSSELMMLICWLLHPDPKRRATVTSLEKNCWVRQKVDISRYKWSRVLPNSDMIDEEEDPIPLVPPTRVETEEDRAINYGPYSKHYDTLHSIGKGAFRFVKLGQRKVDKKQVVVKFIRRAKVFSDCWVQDEKHGRMPLEVSLLTKLDHPNIVKIQDVFENAEFIQMVMEKHGSGMDLFEFIDRSPQMDEALASYIFRQMVSAVSYLHSKNILHRVIKDENVIVNEQFQIKLIDFGAVAFLESGKIFATFCGTLEYCSPEVLMGNKYRGPELEVWSMGVTLYTLVFGENPFFDVDETIKCVLKPPFSVSSELMMLICWLLHPDPKRRATVTSLEKNCWVRQKVDISRYKWSRVLPNSEFHGNTASDNRPDSPPAMKETVSPDNGTSEIDQLKCNLLHQLNLSDSDGTAPNSRIY